MGTSFAQIDFKAGHKLISQTILTASVSLQNLRSLAVRVELFSKDSMKMVLQIPHPLKPKLSILITGENMSLHLSMMPASSGFGRYPGADLTRFVIQLS